MSMDGEILQRLRDHEDRLKRLEARVGLDLGAWQNAKDVADARQSSIRPDLIELFNRELFKRVVFGARLGADDQSPR